MLVIWHRRVSCLKDLMMNTSALYWMRTGLWMSWRTKWQMEASLLIIMAVISSLNAGFTLFLSSAQTTPIFTIVLKAEDTQERSCRTMCSVRFSRLSMRKPWRPTRRR
ncbi:Desmoglein-3 [Labeo rohita]|uniref:Desmoglein-3 n=1 Tax=Labeo rohita TaxID=84645 RepID=A0ABQ8MPH7_LABRO|nr:Desmoglein-3 [Labeo rohita]